MIDYFAGLFGPYPFEVYGVVVPDASTEGAAMENQTVSLFGRDVVEERMLRRVHARDVSSPTNWRTSGSATASPWPNGRTSGSTRASRPTRVGCGSRRSTDQGPCKCAPRVRYEAVSSKEVTLLGDPGVDELFGQVVYERGGLTLHALRDAVGDDLFFGILRDWASQHAHGIVTTEDFIALVEAEDRRPGRLRCRSLL